MSITQATIADSPELTRLVNKAYRGEHSQKGWATEAHLLDGQRIDEETMDSYFADDTIIILKHTNDAGEINACVYLQVKGHELYLGMLSVDPYEQAKGIGKLLLVAAEDVARERGCKAIVMTVITSRTALIEFYERRGYERTGEILPFHVEEKFGIPRVPIELAVLKKKI